MGGSASALCRQALDRVGGSVGASLRAVDCAASEMAQATFGRLFGAEGQLTPALTLLLTLFIAFFAIGLITGRSRIGISTLTPRMVTLILVVTFATSWLAFQSVFYNLAIGAPDQIARILMGSQNSATSVFADKIDVVFGALIQATGDETMNNGASVFSPSGLMWLGGTLLLLGTVGVLATAKIALAVLMALGPVFIVMALFDGTRGLFVGWLKGVVLLAIIPLFAVLGGTMMLELAVPVISSLAPISGEIDPRSAMAFFMIGAVHAALMIMIIKVAMTMVSGWSVFGLTGSAKSDHLQSASFGRSSAERPLVTPLSPHIPAQQAGAIMPAPSRDIRVASTAPIAANDAGRPALIRETRVVSVGSPSSADNSGPSRVRGIGSRFRTSSSQRTNLARRAETSQ